MKGKPMAEIGKWHTIDINTKPSEGYPNPVWYVNITDQLREAVPSDLKAGVMHVFVPHTTATLILNSGVDGTTLHDIRMMIERLVPTSGPFVHLHDGPQDAAGHLRIQFGTNSLALPISDGKLDISISQGLYFLEFDGPRDRRVKFAIQEF